MSYQGIRFKDKREFQSVQTLASRYGYGTVEKFNNFLEMMITNGLLKKG